MKNNKRWNKIQKLESDMKGLLLRCATFDKVTNLYNFRTKESHARYNTLAKSHETNQEKLKREIASETITKFSIPKNFTVSQAFDSVLQSLKEAEEKIATLEAKIKGE